MADLRLPPDALRKNRLHLKWSCHAVASRSCPCWAWNSSQDGNCTASRPLVQKFDLFLLNVCFGFGLWFRKISAPILPLIFDLTTYFRRGMLVFLYPISCLRHRPKIATVAMLATQNAILVGFYEIVMSFHRRKSEFLVWKPGLRGVGRPGLEPGTNALKGRCSTD